uniref:Uncharacterized protein n=1 Tax=Zea mays TaxID=4577 RepID=C4J640_MAIZE|nr:unknown [Zea mays]
MEHIHEPPTIRGDVGFEDVKVQIAQDLQHLQQNAILVHAVNLHQGAVAACGVVDANPWGVDALVEVLVLRIKVGQHLRTEPVRGSFHSCRLVCPILCGGAGAGASDRSTAFLPPSSSLCRNPASACLLARFRCPVPVTSSPCAHHLMPL